MSAILFCTLKKMKKCMLLRELNEDPAGFVLPIFRSASEDVTPTPRGEKEFGAEFNNAH